MKSILSLIICLCLGVLAFTFQMEPYKDLEAFNKIYLGSDNPSEQEALQKNYHQLRESLLTPKYKLQDYALSILILSVMLFIFLKIYSIKSSADFRNIIIPSPTKIVLLGFMAAIGLVLSFLFGLILTVLRKEVPIWADSIGIPLMALPPMCLFFILVLILYSVMGWIEYKKTPLFPVFLKSTRPHWVWIIIFGLPLVLSMAFLILSLIMGAFYFLAPTILWVLFFTFWLSAKKRVSVPLYNQSAL
ncbi:hypothetical protein K1X76_11340 [bacterium]|nr:hypothetical protein [bacterium]